MNYDTERARNMTDCEHGFMKDKKFCIMDRDPVFTKVFRSTLKGAGIQPIRLPPKSPNLNAYMERFIGTVRRELPPDFIPQSESHLRWALQEHLTYYNHERNHQGLDGHVIPFPKQINEHSKGRVVKTSRLGNRLNYYFRAAV